MDKEIIAIPRNQRTFQNTIRPLLAYDHNSQGTSKNKDKIWKVVGSVGTLINVSTVKEVRDAANEASVMISQSSLSRMVQSDLYNAINEFNGLYRFNSSFSRRSKSERWEIWWWYWEVY